ncbi:hypothetical protein [Azoarcus taiwanensis]|uniref:Uncharacterized protein n=2 Tax=Azoarcus taiwanensis TaxID=666964 RepID=A0A972F7M9_9RHOO|nr:hypothetical protein [Azoarcus taiwanensis]NMG03349.1 hypothetical protein [Azoarcus taiwanensis]
MNDQEPISPRRRLQMLLAIPDGERTDAEWDELNELEISLSPVNRVGAPEPVSAGAGASARKRAAKGPSPARSKPQKPANVEKPAAAAAKKPFRRSPRRRAKGGGGTGAGGGGEGPKGDASAS